MKKDRKVLVQKVTDYITNRTSIGNSLKVLYLETYASRVQLDHAHSRLTSVFATTGLTTKQSPELAVLKDYYMHIKMAIHIYDNFVEKMVADATFNAHEGEAKAKSYDDWHNDATDFSKFSLLFFDRTCRDPEQRDKIFEFMKDLESHGLFTEDDIAYFENRHSNEEKD